MKLNQGQIKNISIDITNTLKKWFHSHKLLIKPKMEMNSYKVKQHHSHLNSFFSYKEKKIYAFTLK